MKKNKILKCILSFALVLCSTLMFAACGGSSNPVPGYESGSSAPSPDEGTKPPSSGDDSDVSIGEDGEVEGGEIADFSDFFKGYVVLTNGDNSFKVYDESTGAEVTFNDLLDRQIDVLAEDVLYRLYLTYGSLTYGTSSQYQDIKLYNGNYSKDGAFAKVLKNKALTNESYETSVSVNYDDILTYQFALDTDNDNAFNTSFIMLSEAILGEYNVYNDVRGALIRSNGNYDPTPYKWAYSNNAEDFTSWNNNYKESLKLEIAKALYDETTNLSYEEILNKINYLGYNANFATKLENIIYNVVIGKNLVNRDLEIYNTLTETDKTSPKNWSDESEISKHYYKGYNVVIPAIVEQALNNTFEGIETSIYPIFARVNGGIGNFETYQTGETDSNGNPIERITTTGPIDLNSIILMPKQGSLPVALQLEIACARKLSDDISSATGINDVAYFAHDVVVELEISISYYTNGNAVLVNQVVTPDQEESSVVSIDSKGYVPTYIDYEDPNFDPTRVDEEGYLDQFKKPMPYDGEPQPFPFLFSIYELYPKDTPAFNEYLGYDPEKDTNTLWYNKFETNGESIFLNPGNDYIQFSFNVKSVKQTVDGKLIDYFGDDIVYDISLMPYTF